MPLRIAKAICCCLVMDILERDSETRRKGRIVDGMVNHQLAAGQ